MRFVVLDVRVDDHLLKYLTLMCNKTEEHFQGNDLVLILILMLHTKWYNTRIERQNGM